MQPLPYQKPLADCTVAIAGLGLMGGSLGLALRGRVRQVTGIARRGEAVEQAVAMGAIDRGTLSMAEGVAGADLVVLATPVSVILRQIEELGQLARAGQVREGTVVVDLGSTKERISAVLAGLPATLQPVGAHPMCGKEHSGLAVAEATLYQGAPFVLCPLPQTDPRALDLVTELALAAGARPLHLEPRRHDALVASISHGPYLLSLTAFAAAAEVAQRDDLVWQVAASGFRSATRLAGSDDKMMADILLTNRAAVLEHVERLQAHLACYAELVRAGDEHDLRAAAADIRQRRASFIAAQGE